MVQWLMIRKLKTKRNKGEAMTTENIGEISREIDQDAKAEVIEVQADPETGQLVEFHRETLEDEKTA